MAYNNYFNRLQLSLSSDNPIRRLLTISTATLSDKAHSANPMKELHLDLAPSSLY